MVPFIGIGVLSAKGTCRGFEKASGPAIAPTAERMEAKAYFKPLSGAGFTAKL
jgi:hypothetical protein